MKLVVTDSFDEQAYNDDIEKEVTKVSERGESDKRYNICAFISTLIIVNGIIIAVMFGLGILVNIAFALIVGLVLGVAFNCGITLDYISEFKKHNDTLCKSINDIRSRQSLNKKLHDFCKDRVVCLDKISGKNVILRCNGNILLSIPMSDVDFILDNLPVSVAELTITNNSVILGFK